MSMIESLLTKTQQEQIIKTIQSQCLRYQSFERQAEALYYEPYTNIRKKYSVTSAVISGFAPGRCKIDEVTVSDLNYGLQGKLSQPELYSANGVFHIYSDGSDLKGKRIKELSERYNGDLSSTPVFFLIVFSADKEGQLNKIEIRLPDATAQKYQKKVIYSSSNLISITA